MLNLGQLYGNRFSVALRFIDNDLDSEKIIQNVKLVEKYGFINYFGMQRFGSFTVRTHTIGKHILACNWKEVARLFLVQHADYDQDDKSRKKSMSELVFPDNRDTLKSDEI